MAETNRLTIGERIVVHLSQYVRHEDAYVCPPEIAQSGIARSLGISRAHAAIELKRQMDAGRVTMRTAHVAGMPTRRKVYHLTPKGRVVASEVRARVPDRTVEVVAPHGEAATMSGDRALGVLRRHGVSEGRAVLLVLLRARIDLRNPTVRRPPPQQPVRSAEARANAAFRRTFQRPFAWQLEAVLGPPHVPRVSVAA